MTQLTIRSVAVNRLLATLPKTDYKSLLPSLKLIPLAFGEVLYEPRDVIKHVYFPNDSIVFLITQVSETSSLEVGMVGNEGMAGLPVFMFVDSSRTRALVQGSGAARRMTSASLPREANRPGTLRRLLCYEIIKAESDAYLN